MLYDHIGPEKNIHSAGKVEVRNCRVCNRVFDYLGYGPQVCPECLKKEEELFEKVRSYLESHPRATLVQTTQDTGVPLRKLQAWIKEERLAYCPKCIGKMAHMDKWKRTLIKDSYREDTE